MGKNKALAHHTSTYFHTRRVSSSVANSRSPRAFRKSICAHETVATNLYKYALGRGARTQETDLYRARR